MIEKSSQVTIIGAGLTGLYLAYLLQQKKISVNIVEARHRAGGRIYTTKNKEQAPQEMGATWLGKKHTALIKLLNDLDIGIFEQVLGKHAIYEPISTSPPQLVTLPPNDEPSFRIKGGTSVLTDRLKSLIVDNSIYLGQAVKMIEQEKEGISVKTEDCDFKSAFVISTLPPFLLAKSIKSKPSLPPSLLNIARQTHTWMGESIKVALSYAEPFWREKNTSGTIFSNVGPIPEMYDHANVEDSKFGLKGFLNGNYFSVSKKERLELVMRQLTKYYGEKARNFLSYEETVWRNEPYTFAEYDSHILPHQNNGHQIYREPFLNGKFYVAGAETAEQFPGYMEGAVRSAEFVFEQLDKELIL